MIAFLFMFIGISLCCNSGSFNKTNCYEKIENSTCCCRSPNPVSADQIFIQCTTESRCHDVWNGKCVSSPDECWTGVVIKRSCDQPGIPCCCSWYQNEGTKHGIICTSNAVCSNLNGKCI